MQILREVARKRRFLPVVVKDNLAWDDVSRVAVNTHDLPGVQFDAVPSTANPAVEAPILHAWHAGPQTTQLRDQLAAMPATGTLGTTASVAARVMNPAPVTPAAPLELTMATNSSNSSSCSDSAM